LVDANAALLTIGNNPPVAAFSGTPTSGYAPLTVTFTDASTNNPTSWAWTFGDGGTSTLKNPSHTYTTAGTYTVVLTAANAYGSDSETKTNYITVTAPPTDPPVAAFSGTPTSGTIPLTVVFTDASTNSPTSWAWTFGDGGTSALQNPSHTYTTAGTYTVVLTATNAYGSDSETKTGYITASAVTQQCDDFADGSITNWLNKTGTWTATGGYMKGNSTTSNARTTSPFGTFSTATINCDVRMNTGRTARNARIVFGYVDGSNYRYIMGDDVYNRWTICERVSGYNYTRKTISRTVSTATWYAVKVTAASDGTVTLAIGGTTIGSYKFAAVKSGLVGVGYNNSNSDFDNFCVSASVGAAVADASDQVYYQAAPLPEQYDLKNYPNPFNPTTIIAFTLPADTYVRLDVYNILGQKVATLADGQHQAGAYQYEWDGSKVASGIYLYRLMTDEFSQTKQMVLLK